MRNKEWTIQIALVLALLPAGCGKDKAMNEAAGRQDNRPESAASGAENCIPASTRRPARGCWRWTPRCCAT